jgi:exodeoxyribonuclease V alpha subunit
VNATLAALQKSGHLRRVDGALGDWIARTFPGESPEVALAAALAARAVADGHSALALDHAQAWLDNLEGDGNAAMLPDTSRWCEVLRRSAAVHPLDDGQASTECSPLTLDARRRIYLRRYFEYERKLARSLMARARSTDTTRSDRGTPGADGSTRDEQQRVIDAALSHRFTLITGGPGAGKTHGVLRTLVALAEQAHAHDSNLRIALAAPTGKAAARLRESVRAQLMQLGLPEPIAAQIPHDAGTVHGLIGLSPWSARARHGHDSPLPFDVVVVDEVSMVDLPLMAKLVDAVPDEARLILLGDPGQLSAVEAGDVLGALVEAAREAPLRDCHVALTRSHRFEAGSKLGALAEAIARGDAVAASELLDRAGEVSFVDGKQLVGAAVAAYRAILDAQNPGAALRAARDFRVLTALRKGPSGCIALDRAIAAQLQRAAGVRNDERWWRGRLILITANRPELGLFNGDTGLVWPDSDGVMKVWFGNVEDAPRALPVAALPPHEGAFAQTVHKAQGSEFERVALVTGPDSAVLTRELLYTGVTRARTDITLHTTPATLRAGIERRTLRMTGLADRLHEAAGAPISIAESLPEAE